MPSTIISLIAVGVSLASLANGFMIPKPPVLAASEDFNYSTAYFDQLIDHNNPSAGTFKQRYYWSTSYWKGPGSPVFLFGPGEQSIVNGEGWLDAEASISGVYAAEYGGAGIVLEHRYYGESSPVDTLTPKTMQHLTFRDALLDFVNFANHVQLPFDSSNKSSPANAPWVLIGGSYSGAQAGWVAADFPGTFWAYHASSAPVEAIWDYWQYFVPIQEHIPKNCSTDLVDVIKYMDSIVTGTNETAIQALKNQFLLGDLRNDDFMEALVNGPYQGQSTNGFDGISLFEFCDYIENAYANPPANSSASGVGAEKALAGYAQWWTEVYFPGSCVRNYQGYWTDNYTSACYDSYNSSNPIYADKTIDNMANRQWVWMLCNEPYGAWQDAAPKGTPSIVSSLVTAEYNYRTCSVFFQPDDGYTYAAAGGKRPETVNAWTGGWAGKTERVLWAQGQYDPWREETVSSDYRTGGALKSSESNPIFIMPNASHCYDISLDNGFWSEAIAAIQEAEIKQMGVWLSQFNKTGH